jgi:glycosyltransferase involved in cell wall biosynthesis
MPNLLPLFLRLAGARKVIITLHGFGLYNWLGKMRLTLAAALSDGIIPVSQHIRGSAGRFWGRLGGSITSRLEETVFTGPSIEPLSDVTSDQRKAARAAWRVGPGQLFMAYFGFINDGKGFDDLLKAYRDCLDQQLEVKLVCLAGLETQGNRYHMKMLELIGKLGLKNSVHFTGYLGPREVALALSLADIAVLPFNYGASTKRTTMLAALACGCPVITTGDPSLPEFFRDGENIMLVPPREPVSLARAIMRMGNDPDLRGRIKRGTGELSRHFSWDSIADRHLEIYRRYLERDERGK